MNNSVDWRVNALWSEKIWFVDQTRREKYFCEDDTLDENDVFYGWCDIGYFRNRVNDLPMHFLQQWPNQEKIKSMDRTKIHYACVNNNHDFLGFLHDNINHKNEFGLPSTPIPPNQISIAGGFFIIYSEKIDFWKKMYDDKLQLYFEHGYLVKDDQIIIADCVFSNMNHFQLYGETDQRFDNWFLFQRLLLQGNNENAKQEPLEEKVVSILIPIYNGIEFIHDSLGSVFNQTYKTWEVVIGVNGHPENSNVYKQAVEAANIYNFKLKENLQKNVGETETYSHIRVYDFPNLSNKADTLNEMLKYCNGEYIAILDVDDIWYPKKLEMQAPFLSRYDVVGTKCVYFGEMEKIIPIIPEGDLEHYDFFRSNPVINSSSIIRKEYCTWSNEFVGLDDYELWIKLKKEGRRFYNSREVLVKHRIHHTSAFNSKGNSSRIGELFAKYVNPKLI
jgi:teichuronic acid biosynthesis glycosyltransferase TuaG